MQLRGQLKKPITEWRWGKRAYNAEYNDARCKELARRIMVSLNEVLPVIKPTAEAAPVVKHTVRILDLPPRLITAQERDNAVAAIKKIEADMKAYGMTGYNGTLNWHRRVITRYNTKDTKHKTYN